ncbi:hypothetical protein S7711_03132 [Stachybotrys chartarum IBT 7711]|uniref:Glycosyl transferase CAP10 domain-containing protein n=1 Tax=Stachybotrys chartarum (strain CBS 109288 / IBT 7711) TaxID=1280523 RepID=A0A084B8F8_STACB|nr:hypothetical protein S7711_03132 [Stachybotrys chartarum IBT 7711]
MAKILSPAFPPRRPSGYIRYGLVAIILILIFYSLNHQPADQIPSSSFTQKPVAKPPLQPLPPPRPGANIIDDDVRAGVEAGSGHGIGSAHAPAANTNQHANEEENDAEDGDNEEEDDAEAPKTPEQHSPESSSSNPPPPSAADSPGPDDGHPIDKLIYDAQHEFAGLLSKESKTLSEAAQAYRKRRGRHPPPGFDKWYEFAESKNAVIVEDFFDQMYHDLEPFWGMEPALIRKEAQRFDQNITIRNGEATTECDWFWTTIWLELIVTIQHLLPDMDIALNPMDEPRIVVPWEEVNKYVSTAAHTVKLVKPDAVVSDFQKLPPPKTGDPAIKIRGKKWEKTPNYWSIARRGCPPESPARTTPLLKSVKGPPEIGLEHAEAHSYKGYVSNYTLSTEMCHQPDLQGLEGILIHPLSTSSTKTLFPLFGGSKLAVNNEILLPAPMYWNEEERFTGGEDHGVPWANKQNKVVWRGVATGGKNNANNWRRFQRHRFVAMNNATAVSRVERGGMPENWAMPDEQYDILAQKDGKLGDWLREWTDVSFIDLMCEKPNEDHTCSYTSPFFEVTEGLKMVEQFNYKYLPDIDGNSFSGRYLGFLRSTSLPIKATLFREWHDSRLVAWKHFVPMDTRFGDYLGIMEYFLGYQGRRGHDAAAEKIATEGKQWAEKVLRKEDMQIYVLRVLLEYARISDERRESMGWVGDVLADPSLEEIWSDWWS